MSQVVPRKRDIRLILPAIFLRNRQLKFPISETKSYLKIRIFGRDRLSGVAFRRRRKTRPGINPQAYSSMSRAWDESSTPISDEKTFLRRLLRTNTPRCQIFFLFRRQRVDLNFHGRQFFFCDGLVNLFGYGIDLIFKLLFVFHHILDT
jgi:hypothetical protein